MTRLSDLSLEGLVQHTEGLLTCLKSLLADIDKCERLPEARTFHDVAGYLIGQLGKCRQAAICLDVTTLASATRSLFECTFIVEYICASEENLGHFKGDSALDELEIFEKLEALDRREPGCSPSPAVEARKAQRRAEVVALKLEGRRPWLPRRYAKAVGRAGEYNELYRFYSKLTHATAWAILGSCSWDMLALFVLSRANLYAAECWRRLAQHTGFV
jgi:hypothetical protein